MESTYTTKQGDVWDKIAYEVYGDEEYTGWLMENNFPLLDTFVFDAGVVLQTPAPPEQTAANDRDVAHAVAQRGLRLVHVAEAAVRHDRHIDHAADDLGRA